jgi:hypothetical protein
MLKNRFRVLAFLFMYMSFIEKFNAKYSQKAFYLRRAHPKFVPLLCFLTHYVKEKEKKSLTAENHHKAFYFLFVKSNYP